MKLNSGCQSFLGPPRPRAREGLVEAGLEKLGVEGFADGFFGVENLTEVFFLATPEDEDEAGCWRGAGFSAIFFMEAARSRW